MYTSDQGISLVEAYECNMNGEMLSNGRKAKQVRGRYMNLDDEFDLIMVEFPAEQQSIKGNVLQFFGGKGDTVAPKYHTTHRDGVVACKEGNEFPDVEREFQKLYKTRNNETVVSEEDNYLFDHEMQVLASKVKKEN